MGPSSINLFFAFYGFRLFLTLTESPLAGDSCGKGSNLFFLVPALRLFIALVELSAFFIDKGKLSFTPS